MTSLTHVEQGLFDGAVHAMNSGLYSQDAADALSAGAEVGPPEVKGVIQTTRRCVQLLNDSNPAGLQEAIQAQGEPCASRIQAIVDTVHRDEVGAVA